MSVSLPLKYRPQTFEALVGQDYLVRFLSELIKRDQKGRNLIISGPQGSGKTSSARIYGRALNCEHPTASGSPCMVCDNCKLLGSDGKGHPDYQEFAAAEEGGIKEVKSLIELARVKPLLGKFRIIALDEVQSLSKEAFDSLLKILEEPPPHLVLIFLTTESLESKKIPTTVQSRCAKLEVKTLTQDAARKYIEYVCNAEGLQFEPQALDLLVHQSKGHVRNILQDLDQLSHYGPITLETTKEVFGFSSIDYVYRYVLALQSGNFQEQLKAISEWGEPIGNQFTILQEFFLYYFYRYVLRVSSFVVNPMLLLLSEGQWQEIHRGFQGKARDINVPLEDFFEKVNNFWTTRTPATSQVALHYVLVSLHNLLNVNGLRGTQIPKTAPNTMKMAATRQNRSSRIFTDTNLAPVKDTILQENPVIPVPPVEVVPETPKLEGRKLYPHSLQQHGFGRPISVTEVEM